MQTCKLPARGFTPIHDTPLMNRCLTTFLASLASAFAVTTNAAQFKFPNQTLTVPDGFAVELVAATNLLSRPISGSFDEQGRL